MKIENNKCSNCGGILKFDPNKQLLVCEYCKSEFAITDDKNIKDNHKKDEDKEYCNHMNEYHCPSCGATMVVDDNTATDTCVYCHSNVTLTGRLKGDIAPDKIIPFQYDINQAKDGFLKYVKKHKFIPRNYFNESQLNNIQGIYYPFWIVDIDLSANATFSAESVSSWSDSTYSYTKTDSYSLVRSGNIHLEDVASCAIKDVNKKMLEGVFPYPQDKHLDFNKSYLVGYKSQKKDLEKSDVSNDVLNKAKTYSIAKLQENTHSYSSVALTSYSNDIKKEDWSYVLMPIYVLTYTKNNKTYTYAMNGYSGKTYGEYPLSFLKLATLSLAIILIGLIIGLVVYFSW